MIKLSPSRLACAMLAFASWLPLHANAGLLDDDEARKAILDLRAKASTCRVTCMTPPLPRRKPRTDMLYAIIATDVANSLEKRLSVRPAHVSGNDCVEHVSPRFLA